MNLITDPWIPVRCFSGTQRLISPLQLTDSTDPPLELAAIRPDINGALAQFLVGVLQLIAPDSDGEWRKIAEGRALPELDQLREYAPNFEFDQGDRRFMQDMDLDAGELGDLAALMLEAPGENTVKNNADLFVKRQQQLILSMPLAAQALLTLQINAPSGGQGHRTSLRGGGPVSILLWPRQLAGQIVPLWQKLWLNTLTLAGAEPRMEIVFPWTGPCLTSENNRDVHTLLAGKNPSELELTLLCYFATPRRIRLHFSEHAQCTLSGEFGPCADGYETRNFGADYHSDRFRHPLSPYYRAKAGSFLPMHVGAAGFSYVDWVALQDSPRVNPDWQAPAILNRSRLGMALNQQLGDDAIWAFGYAMDNMKCLAWHEARFPHFPLDPERLAAVLIEAKRWIGATEHARKALSRQLRAAWSDKGKDGDTSTAERELYLQTERDFYLKLRSLIGCSGSDADKDEQRQLIRRAWHGLLVKKALELFQRHAEVGDVIDSSLQSIERTAIAHRHLLQALYGELKDILELDVAERAAKASKRRKVA